MNKNRITKAEIYETPSGEIQAKFTRMDCKPGHVMSVSTASRDRLVKVSLNLAVSTYGFPGEWHAKFSCWR